MFQSTHPRRVRRFLWPLAAGYTLRFNPRTHAGCDGMVVTVTTIRRMFQSTHPRRVRRWLLRSFGFLLKFQSTHPRRARLVRLEHRAARVVSIHAPTQGATGLNMSAITDITQFQSTHPRRVRHQQADRLAQQFVFQSTHPRRVRRLFAPIASSRYSVSIHAPTQGATMRPAWIRSTRGVSIHAPTQGATRSRRNIGAKNGFNPRTHAGCDMGWTPSSSTCTRFQSTHPRRVRRRDDGMGTHLLGVSIHAPTQGATRV